jgi:ATP-dependent Lhr-like helicase
VYGVLKVMEETGSVRRGYFVDGLGAAQFAMPGAIDRLRSARDAASAPAIALAATDPAQPFGAALPWPEVGAGRPARTAGAYVVLVDGRAGAFLERGARSLVTFDEPVDRWIDALAALVKDGRIRKIELRRIDGTSATDASIADDLSAAGFVDSFRGLVLRG